jgi:hypothetical protein
VVTGPAAIGPFAFVVVVVVVGATKTRYCVLLMMIWPHSLGVVLPAPPLGGFVPVLVEPPPPKRGIAPVVPATPLGKGMVPTELAPPLGSGIAPVVPLNPVGRGMVPTGLAPPPARGIEPTGKAAPAAGGVPISAPDDGTGMPLLIKH